MRSSANRDIRETIAKKRIFTYEVAEEMGISTSGLYTILQRPITPVQRYKILTAIDAVSASKQ